MKQEELRKYFLQNTGFLIEQFEQKLAFYFEAIKLFGFVP